MAAPRHVPLSARLLLLSREMGVPALWIAVWLPFLAHSYADSAYVLWFRDTVDLPARVVSARLASESRGRTVPRWEGYRVEAEFGYQGQSWRATGEMSGLPVDGRLRVRVPRTRPDLAVAFDGVGPWYRQTPVWLALGTLLGVVFLLMMLTANRRQLRLLATGTLAMARCALQQDKGATKLLTVAFGTPRGDIVTTRSLLRNEAQRVLAEPNPVVAYLASDPRELFILSECPGLRLLGENDGVAPVPWRALVWRTLPLAVLLAVSVYALIVSRILPL
jgi:hypothetical protein